MRPICCPQCGAPATRPDRAACEYCGAILTTGGGRATGCPDCGEPVSLDAGSCPHCAAAGPFYPSNRDQSLLLAIKRNDVNMVFAMLNGGADVNRNPLPPADPCGFTPLDAAETYGRIEIANVLIRHGGRRSDPSHPRRPLPPDVAAAIEAAVRTAFRSVRR